MSLLHVIRGAVAIADQVTKPLQVTVTHQVAQSDGGIGAVGYTDVSRVAIVDKKQRQVKSASGVLTMSTASVMFIDPAVVVTTLDRIILPDGTSGPVVAIGGFMDAGTGKVMFTEAYLG